MFQVANDGRDKSLRFDGADLEIRAQMTAGAVTINVMKQGSCVHRLVIDDAATPLEHGWLADLFAREDRVDLAVIAREADEYVGGLNINQG